MTNTSFLHFGSYYREAFLKYYGKVVMIKNLSQSIKKCEEHPETF